MVFSSFANTIKNKEEGVTQVVIADTRVVKNKGKYTKNNYKNEEIAYFYQWKMIDIY
jgi:hypothetical protein